MKKLLILLFVFFVSQDLIAQKIKVGAADLIIVNGVPSFYVVKKGTFLGYGDYLLKDLNNKDIAYCKPQEARDTYGYNTSSTRTIYLITFVATGNQAYLDRYTSLSYQKSIARDFANADLFLNGVFVPEKERTFVLSHNGVFNQNYNNNNYDKNNQAFSQNGNNYNTPQQQSDNVTYSYNDAVPINDNTTSQNPNNNPDSYRDNSNNILPDTYTPDDNLVINGNQIFNNKIEVGNFKISKNNNSTVVKINTKNNLKLNAVNTGDKWQVTGDNIDLKINYNATYPLQALFAALLNKKILN